MKGPGRTILKYLLGVMVFYVLLEITSFVSLHVLQVIRPEHFVDAFVDNHFDSITEEERIKFFERSYDRTLGWRPRPLGEYHSQNTINQEYTVSYDADGSRRDNLPSKENLIATYGDSFTRGDEIDNHQTWQYFLESRIGYEVKNFGVGGYGTGQAVLRMEKHLSRGKVAPITILGIFEENINRVVNSFRPFYNSHTQGKLGFKPYFRLAPNGQVEMIPNPSHDSEASLQDLRKLAKRLNKQEFWTIKSKKIKIGYPYTYQLIRATYMFGSRKLRAWSGEKLIMWENVNLWKTEEGRAVMHHLVDKFMALTTEAQSLPIILFFPEGNTLKEGGAARYAKFKKEISSRHNNLKIIDVMDLQFEKNHFNIQPYGGHPSPYGNEVIARGIEKVYHQISKEHNGKIGSLRQRATALWR